MATKETVSTETEVIEKKRGKIYHVSKREKDNKWQIKISGGKVLKLFDTKAQALAYVDELADNQEAGIIVHNSKGKKKGKFSSR